MIKTQQMCAVLGGYRRRVPLTLLMAVTFTAATFLPGSESPARAGKADGPVAPPAGLLTPFEQKRHEVFVRTAAAGNVDLLFLGDSAVEFWLEEGAGKSAWNEHYAERRTANFGVQGADTKSLLWRLRNGELDGFGGSVVVFSAMVSADRANGATDADILEGNAAIVAEIRKQRPRAKIVLTAVPRSPYPDSPLRPLETALMDDLARLADNRAIYFVDLRPTFLKSDGSLDTSLLSGRGSALNAKGYQTWAVALNAKLLELM